jgi:serine/threonine protein kinase
MKKIDKEKITKKYKDKKYYLNEKFIVDQLSHPYVIKCYKTFEESNFLYFIMEFMNNGDLLSYNNGNIGFHVLIPEGKLWDIFYKCLSGLNYIHEKGIIHRDIKLKNLFLDDNFNVKIGDFNVSVVLNEEYAKKFSNNKDEINNLMKDKLVVGTEGYKSPEILYSKEYDQKSDIYSIGIAFFVLCFGCPPTVCRNNSDNQKYYSEEIKSFILNMIKQNPNERPTSKEAMLIAQNYFIKTYLKNTSLEASFNCLYNFPNFNEFFSNNDNANFIYDSKKEITQLCLSIILSMKNKDEKQIQIDLYHLRKLLEKEGLDIQSDNKEIDPGKLIIYFIKKLNTDLNEVVENKINNEQEERKLFKILSKTYHFPPGDEKNFFKLRINCYNRKILSFISRNFFSFMMTQRICKYCHSCRRYFSKMYMIPINVNILEKVIGNNNEISLNNGLNHLVKTKINIGYNKRIFCKICNNFSEFEESKCFYHTAKNLIIIFDRGENCQNKTFVDFERCLTLKNALGTINRVDYKLYGIIEKYNEEYISYIYQNNIWLSSKGEKINKENLSQIKNHGIIVALFYYDQKNISIESLEKIDLSSIKLHEQIFIKEQVYKNILLNNQPQNNYNQNIQNNHMIIEQPYYGNSNNINTNFNFGNQQTGQIQFNPNVSWL